MKRILATILTAVMLLFFPVVVATPSTPRILDSIRPLQWVDPGSPHLNNHCTTFSVNSLNRIWLTAAHCVSVGAGMTKYGPIMIPRVSPRNFYIDGHPAVVILADFETDIAVLATADYAVPSLKLAKAGPEYLAIITTAGYPYGLGPVINVGYVSNPSMEDPRAKAYMLMAIASCPGNSGGPILNSKNEVISVMQTSSGVGCAGVMGGAPYNDLVRVAGKYFSK